MTRLAIIDRNLEHGKRLRANVDRLQSKINIIKADIANTKEREDALREAENQWRDKHSIKGRQ